MHRLSFILVLCTLAATSFAGPNWPGFRGEGNSLTEARDLPLKWGEDESVAWTAELTGYGQSSPVIWGDTIFVTSVQGKMKEKLIVAAFDLYTGKTQWSKAIDTSTQVEVSDYISKAAPTPIVDQERLITFFESGDLIAFDHAGNTLWQRSLTKEYGPFLGNHGIGTSLAQTEDAAILLIDHSGPGYLLAIDKKTGKNLWKIEREKRVSWSSPIVAHRADKTEILISSNGIVEAFDAANGKRLWHRDGLKGNTVASPTVTKDTIYIGASETDVNMAIKRNATRDDKAPLSDDQILWRAEEASSSFASPLVFDGTVYYTSKAGIAYALDAASGKQKWMLRLGDSCWASPIGVEGRIYFFLTRGKTLVVKPGDEPEIIAENVLPIEGRIYGVAPVDGAFILRNGTKLICVGKPLK